LRIVILLISAGWLGIAFGQQASTSDTDTSTDTGGYTGPAVLSTAGSPIGKYLGQPISFRFFAGANATYNTDLTQPVTNEQGQLTKANGYGGIGQLGFFGVRNGAHDSLGVDFWAGYRAYAGTGRQRYNGADFRLRLNYARQVTMKTAVQLSARASTYGYSYGGLSQSIVADPTPGSADPAVDGFDSRTNLVSGSAGVAHNLSRRWVATFSGGAFVNQRRSRSLISSRGFTASGSAAYSLNETTSIGGGYSFGYYFYPNRFGESWIHTFSFIFNRQLSPNWSMSSSAGVNRVTGERVESFQLDPVLAAIVGRSTTVQPVFIDRWGPAINVTFVRRFQSGSASIYYSRGISAGNSFFTASDRDRFGVRYSYTATDRLNFGCNAGYYRYDSLLQNNSKFNNYGLGAGMNYRFTRSLHLTVGTTYWIGKVKNGNLDRNRVNAFIGITFSPGDRPLSLF